MGTFSKYFPFHETPDTSIVLIFILPAVAGEFESVTS